MTQLNISHLAFLTPGNYPDDAPWQGLEETLQLFETGERLGYNGAWVRQRHLEHGVSSASTFLAAASQRTSTIELGTAVIQVGYESPFRLAEDLSTVDVLSHGRLNVGLSAGQPAHAELLGPEVFDDHWRAQDFSYHRVTRLIDNLSGRYLGDKESFIESPGNRQRPRLQPYAPGLTDRLWYGGGSLRSVKWAGSQNLNLLIGNLTSGEGTDDYYTAQLRQIEAFRSALPANAVRTPRIARGRVVVPFDSADAATRKRYADFAASRHARTLSPQGERRTLFSPDLVGSADQILEQLHQDPLLQEVEELRIELPYEFNIDQYQQILTDFITLIAPEIGWSRATPVDYRATA
ncbi:LLM class flavin-dependent oxidoreductase [Rouxiella badensis]|jgi:alkanesulfonate monooxygenase SsuD/methylene tetrahydromethanopterin reductase-like flavin-dependent oxidoreductase (luciferase family)|uniref:LLM class flavin-dependent oxidoreductase n=1 Tax=Rouxiella badensis TaxID=1646377 RepID=UPI001B43F0A3|nr:LLM class flavin-dependent oxidoreductase [Rouxiella badensis]MCC3748878.1 LLM class flavin-dependent oxidoreductase [Rouxiella badensis]